MPLDRYTVQKDVSGWWSVIDISTSLPAHHRNHVMIRMGLDEADAAADLLNQLEVRNNPAVQSYRFAEAAE